MFGALMGLWRSLECAVVGTSVRRSRYFAMGLMDWGVDNAELIALLGMLLPFFDTAILLL
jgi:hypothetical protein